MHSNELDITQMTQAKHTPGPWHQSDDIRQIKSGNGIIVCNVSGALSNPSVLADSNIIAAAPELLEACLAMIEWDDREKDHAVSFENRMELCTQAFTKARAAIAKATGA